MLGVMYGIHSSNLSIAISNNTFSKPIDDLAGWAASPVDTRHHYPRICWSNVSKFLAQGNSNNTVNGHLKPGFF